MFSRRAMFRALAGVAALPAAVALAARRPGRLDDLEGDEVTVITEEDVRAMKEALTDRLDADFYRQYAREVRNTFRRV